MLYNFTDTKFHIIIVCRQRIHLRKLIIYGKSGNICSQLPPNNLVIIFWFYINLILG